MRVKSLNNRLGQIAPALAVCVFLTAPSVFAQTLVGAQFRKSHGPNGNQNISIDITKAIGGNVSVESRDGAAGHVVVFQFDVPVTSVAGATSVNSAMAPLGVIGVPTISGNEVSVPLTGVPDNSRGIVSVSGINGTANFSVAVGFLLGDTESSGTVTNADVSATKARSGLQGTLANARFDINASGGINAPDISAVKANVGFALPPVGQASLRIVFSGLASGKVVSSPAGIDCPSATCFANFAIGSMLNLTATPNIGGAFSGWSGACSGVSSATSLNLSNSADCIASFTPLVYAVTPSAGANGTISPTSVQMIVHGNSTAFTLAPSVGYSATVGGTCGGTLTGNTYTTSPVTAPCTVSATFAASLVTVTPSAGSNGAISPSTPQGIPYGTQATFMLSPNVNYTAAVGGTCGGTLSGNTYTTNPITTACTVAATFTRLSYTVTPSAGANGTISPASPQTVLSGATKAFTVTANSGYKALVGGTCGGTLSGNTFTTTPISGNCSVVATFASTTPKYVATTGNDSTGTGTSANPWKTLAKGISSLVTGETLIVKNGVYTGTTNFIKNVPNGTAAQYTVISAENPMQVRIQSTTTLSVSDNQLNLSGSYIKVDGFIFDMMGTINPAYSGIITGDFNTLTRSIFKRGGDIDATGGLLQVTGSDTLIEDVAGTGACRYCFTQGGSNASTQRNVWRRVVGRFDYSNSTLAKATFATEGSSTPNNVRDHIYQNIIAIDGSNPGNLGGAEKIGGIYFSQNTSNIQVQGSIVLNEGAGSAGAFMRELGSNNSAANLVVWDTRGGLTSPLGVVGGTADSLTVGGTVTGAATDLLSPATNSLLKPAVNPSTLTNNTPGAVVTKRYGVSGTRWGQTGYNQITATDLWPWPNEAMIQSVFREANSPPPGNSPSSNMTTRGFAANGNGIYGGPITLSSYVFEYLGTPCPSPICSLPNSAVLAWDPVVAVPISGYRVYYGTAPGVYLQALGAGISVGMSTGYTVNGLTSGTRYYFAVTAFDANGLESSTSNEVFKDVP